MIKTKTYEFKGRVYSEIPNEVTDKLDLKAGDELYFDVGEDVKLKVLKGNSFLALELLLIKYDRKGIRAENIPVKPDLACDAESLEAGRLLTEV